MKNDIDQIDNEIIHLIIQGNQVNEIAKIINRSTRYILYRLSNLKISFNCKTTCQLIYNLILTGLIK